MNAADPVFNRVKPLALETSAITARLSYKSGYVIRHEAACLMTWLIISIDVSATEAYPNNNDVSCDINKPSRPVCLTTHSKTDGSIHRLISRWPTNGPNTSEGTQ